MSDLEQRVQLPPSGLGENRCFAISYYGAGDIHISAWAGDIYQEVDEDTDNVANFGLRHGTDVRILGSLIGFLRRSGVNDKEISEILTSAGADILSDEVYEVDRYMRSAVEYAHKIASGEDDGYESIEVEGEKLSCVMHPEPTQPGRIEQVGGTGIYTKTRHNGGMLLVFAGIKPTRLSDASSDPDVATTAEFCQDDIPKMAQAVCDLALGEYRLDLKQLLLLELTDYEVF